MTLPAVIAALLLLQQPADSRLGLRVEPAFGRAFESGWTTFLVTVTNDSPAETELVIRLRPLGGRTAAERREKFAARTSKRLFMYLDASESGHKLHAQISDASGKLLHEQELERNWDVYSSTSEFPVLAIQDVLPPGCDSSGSWFRCPEANVPDRWIGFSGFRAIYLRGTRLEALRAEQRQALLEWVRLGGIAILNPGTNVDWLKSPAAQELAPVAVGDAVPSTGVPAGLTMTPAPESQTYLLHRLLNGDRLFSGPGGVSAVTFPQGLGTAVVLGFDPDQKPFTGSTGLHRLRTSIITSVPPRVPGQGPRLAADWPEIAQVSASIVNTLPPTLLLVGLALAFILIVGPVNFLVLRRMKMPLLMVVTVPALSILFLGIVVGAGYLVRGVSTVTHDLCFIEATQGSPLAYQVRMLGVSSPGVRSYDLSWPAGESGATPHGLEDRPHYRRRGAARESEDVVVVDQTDAWVLKGSHFSQWQFRAFQSASSRDLGGGVSFSADEQEVRIENRSTHGLKRGVIVSVSEVGRVRYLPFDAVAAGASARFTVTPRPRAEGCLGAGTVEDRLLQNWLQRPGHRFAGAFEFLVAVLDRGPAEVGINAARSSSSERITFLQVLQP